MNDLLSRMLMRVTQASPVEPVLPSRYERAGAFASGETFEPVEGESKAGIGTRPMTRRREQYEDGEAFATPARRPARRRSGELEQREESSIAAELRGVSETQQRESLDDALSRTEARRQVTAEVVRREAALPVRDEGTRSVPEVRIERKRVGALPENAPSRAPSPTRELTREAARQTEVHVTIGHIEVRAVAAPAKAPARKVVPPSLSLQEYLARRNGGSR